MIAYMFFMEQPLRASLRQRRWRRNPPRDDQPHSALLHSIIGASVFAAIAAANNYWMRTPSEGFPITMKSWRSQRLALALRRTSKTKE